MKGGKEGREEKKRDAFCGESGLEGFLARKIMAPFASFSRHVTYFSVDNAVYWDFFVVVQPKPRCAQARNGIVSIYGRTLSKSRPFQGCITTSIVAVPVLII